jgi:hypothetical protein
MSRSKQSTVSLDEVESRLRAAANDAVAVLQLALLDESPAVRTRAATVMLNLAITTAAFQDLDARILRLECWLRGRNK